MCCKWTDSRKKVFFIRRDIKHLGNKLFVTNSKFDGFYIAMCNVIYAYSDCNCVAMQKYIMDIPSLIMRIL